MRPGCKRAYLLTEMLGMLPAIAFILLGTLRLVDRVVAIQSAAGRWSSEQMLVRGVVDRIAADVRSAERVHIESSEAGSTLVIEQGDRQVCYQSDGRRLTRTDAAEEEPGEGAAWQFDVTEVGFEVETLGPGAAVVWTRVTMQTPVEVGAVKNREGRNLALQARQMAAAALVGGEARR